MATAIAFAFAFAAARIHEFRRDHWNFRFVDQRIERRHEFGNLHRKFLDGAARHILPACPQRETPPFFTA
jgi:hypothetical protein